MSILPSNESKELHILDDALETLFSEVGITQPPLLPMTADVVLLPYLAKQYDLDISLYDVEQSRELISKGLWLKSKIGTVSALKESLSVLGEDVVLKEWFQYAGDPYRFSIHLSMTNKEITPLLRNTIFRIVHTNKNIRSVLDELILSYKIRYTQSIMSGAVGEVSTKATMIEGYSFTAQTIYHLKASAVGEINYTVRNTR